MSRINLSPARKGPIPRAGKVLVVMALIGVLWSTFPRFADPEFGLAHSYVSLADDIAMTGSYAHRFPDGRIEPETLREPLYPYALVLAKRVLGGYDRIVSVQRAAIVGACLIWILAAWRWYGFASAAALTALLLFNPVITFYAAVLYPYAFNVLFVSAALMATVQVVRRRGAEWAALGGLMFGLAVYERGSLALLPLLLVACLFGIPSAVPRGSLALLTGIYLASVLPWICRNTRHGVTGMNGMVGWALGYTYGDMVLSQTERDPGLLAKDPYGLETKYLDFVRRETSDGGTIDFIRYEMAGGKRLGDANKVVVYYVKEAILRDPLEAWRIVRRNLALFPSRMLVWPVKGDEAWRYYRANVCQAARLSWADLVPCALGLIGLAMMVLDRAPVVFVMLPTLFYLVAMNSVMIVDDPRYRNGVFDIFVYMAAVYALRWGCRQMNPRYGRARRAPPPADLPR